MYAQIAPLDPEGELQYEWLNSRGAIARFERNAIEIRLLDTQETPIADLAIARLVAETVRALCEQRWCSLDQLAAIATHKLRAVLDRTIEHADEVVIADPELLGAFGIPDAKLSAGELWAALSERLLADAHTPDLQHALGVILREGPLARRIVRALGSDPHPNRIREIYRELAQCLHEGRMYGG
jgi:carboxylate-amine ligase